MRQSIGRISSAILELLLPSATARAGCVHYCQVNSAGTKHRCCTLCVTLPPACTPYVAPGSCKGVNCSG